MLAALCDAPRNDDGPPAWHGVRDRPAVLGEILWAPGSCRQQDVRGDPGIVAGRTVVVMDPLDLGWSGGQQFREATPDRVCSNALLIANPTPNGSLAPDRPDTRLGPSPSSPARSRLR